MTPEEKYNHALERASKLRVQNPFDTVGQMVEHIFPELRDDDEKVRKDIIRVFKGEISFTSEKENEKYIAWLEKQGKRDTRYEYLEELLEADTIYQTAINDAMVEEAKTKAMEAISNMNIFELLGLEKQDEQPTDKIELNPDCSEEDDRVRKGLIKSVSRIFEGHKLFDTDVTREEALAWLEKQDKKEYVLKSSRDEDVREFMRYIKKQAKAYEFDLPNRGYDIYAFAKDILHWLEKQGEQPTDKKVGDWVVQENIGTYKIIEVCESWYEVIDNQNNHYSIGFDKEDMCHLWTIADAKEGDVLVDEDGNIGLYSEEKDDSYWHSCIYLGCDDCLRGFSIGGYHKHKNTEPATKEQRELLFSKMRKAGYEWDTDEKKLKNIESKFKVGDWIVGDEGIFKITRYEDERGYELTGTTGYVAHFISPDYVESNYHLWTIQDDAKDGDVLATENFIFIFKNIDNENGVHYHCQYEISKHQDDEQFDVALPQSLMGRVGNGISHYSPATKEQRELLFENMKQAGYEWNAENKKLCGQILKITPKFRVGQLITDDNGNWYKITNIKCLDDWYYEIYDVCEDDTHLESCSVIDAKFKENRFVDEIKKMMEN